MIKLKLIVAVDKNWGIGKNNELLFKIPADMKFFREKTAGGVVCMGRKNFCSLPCGGLKNRLNIVLTSKLDELNGAVSVHSMEDLFELLEKNSDKELFVIGGGEFYRTMTPYCSEAYITKVDADGSADVFIDNFDSLKDWNLVETSEKIETNGYYITFNKYLNSNPIQF